MASIVKGGKKTELPPPSTESVPGKETNIRRLAKTGSKLSWRVKSQSLAKAGKHQERQFSFVRVHCLHLNDENCTLSFISVSKETIKSVSN